MYLIIHQLICKIRGKISLKLSHLPVELFLIQKDSSLINDQFIHLAACGPHEVHDDCAPYYWCYNCTDLNPPYCSGCVARCRCETGFARNDEGICIPREECP